MHADEGVACDRLKDGEVLIAAFPEHLFHKRLTDPENFFSAVFHRPDTGIGEVIADGDSHIGRQRPWGGGPDDEVFVLTVLYRELYKDGRVFLVPVLHFRVGNGRLTAWAEVDHPVAAFKKALLFRTLQGPPCRLHVVGGDGLVGVCEVHPDAQAAELVGHDLLVGDGKVLTLLDEFADAVGLDVLFGRKTEFMFHPHLDGEAVHVIACPVDDVVALHAAEAQNRILDYFIPCSAEMDVAGSVWGAVHKKPGGISCMLRLDLCVNVVCIPEGADCGLHLLCVKTARDLSHTIIPLTICPEILYLQKDRYLCGCTCVRDIQVMMREWMRCTPFSMQSSVLHPAMMRKNAWQKMWED
ncbi:hypothetical protein MKMG_01248 [Methanogenium sp. MK-MG]|nr:hypothetical protein MKMG_01248 [Methanogenium sp. MK-MG]